MIAIKDVKLPVDCQSCFARFGSWCRLDLDERMVVPALPEESVNGFKPEWCPLVDVPDMNVWKCSEIPNSSDCVSGQAVLDALEGEITVTGIENAVAVKGYANLALDRIKRLPSVQPETAKRMVGKSKDGMTLWYQCNICNEPVDAQDNFCRGCGRRLTDG